ncbi:protein inhibitor of activated stat [Cyclospora cayetanensis]|uniref:Protein inhibitor of activated stat n=1 Tax=Cyclospora cayetanensis TaxID=88456 RepID=A0A1D3CU15_9EIME|nr:protein inhibitor of activated stat [Cyclospora cayetanensis]
MDPFNPVIRVFFVGASQDCLTFSLDASELKAWRAAAKEVFVRCCEALTPVNIQTWPRTAEIVINGRVFLFAVTFLESGLKEDTGCVGGGVACLPPEGVASVGVFLAHLSRAESIDAQGDFTRGAVLRCVWIVLGETKGPEALQESEDEEVQCLEVGRRLKLLCPITFTRIEVPCRGRLCRHLQCYDLEGFLQVSRGMKAFNSRWRCPQCHLVVLPHDLVVDGFFLYLLKQTGEDDTEVELQADLSFRVLSDEELKAESKRAEQQRQLAAETLLKPKGEETEPTGKVAFEVVEMLTSEAFGQLAGGSSASSSLVETSHGAVKEGSSGDEEPSKKRQRRRAPEGFSEEAKSRSRTEVLCLSDSSDDEHQRQQSQQHKTAMESIADGDSRASTDPNSRNGGAADAPIALDSDTDDDDQQAQAKLREASTPEGKLLEAFAGSMSSVVGSEGAAACSHISSSNTIGGRSAFPDGGCQWQAGAPTDGLAERDISGVGAPLTSTQLPTADALGIAAAAPTVGAPAVGIPTVGAPTVAAPTVGVPAVAASAVAASALDAPTVGAPAVAASALDAPTVGAPAVGDLAVGDLAAGAPAVDGLRALQERCQQELLLRQQRQAIDPQMELLLLQHNRHEASDEHRELWTPAMASKAVVASKAACASWRGERRRGSSMHVAALTGSVCTRAWFWQERGRVLWCAYRY